MICLQFGLGIWTVWSNKAADIATLHVLVGAAGLVTGALLTLVATIWGNGSGPQLAEMQRGTVIAAAESLGPGMGAG